MTYKLYSSNISYFSGKMECYLHAKNIPFEIVELNSTLFREEVIKNTQLAKMPAIECDDGTWLTDTSPMIGWFEERYPDRSILPNDSALEFIAHLLEDYGDEWLWRPALHYRWSYAKDRELVGERIAGEMLRTMKVPHVLAKAFIKRRQIQTYVKGDGVSPATRAHVEGTYLRTLDAMAKILESRPFLLGDRPSLADFGFFGPMFRHFGLDPTPQRIMLERAPGVFEWVARMWNARKDTMNGDFIGEPDEALALLLSDIGSMYMPYLKKNAVAWSKGSKTFNALIEGNLYENLPTAQYRVYCLEQLQLRFTSLDEAAQEKVEAWLKGLDILDVLKEPIAQASYYDPDGLLPVCSGNDGKQEIARKARKSNVWGRS